MPRYVCLPAIVRRFQRRSAAVRTLLNGMKSFGRNQFTQQPAGPPSLAFLLFPAPPAVPTSCKHSEIAGNTAGVDENIMVCRSSCPCRDVKQTNSISSRQRRAERASMKLAGWGGEGGMPAALHNKTAQAQAAEATESQPQQPSQLQQQHVAHPKQKRLTTMHQQHTRHHSTPTVASRPDTIASIQQTR